MSRSIVRRWLASKLNAAQLIRKMDGDPHQIASGYSLGIFIGMMPLVGVKAIIAVTIASFFKWNKLAAGIGVFNINPITAPFFFGLNFLIGKQITGCGLPFGFSEGLSFNFFKQIFMNSPKVLLTLAIGGFILGIPFAFFAYHLSYFTIRKFKKQ